MSSRSKDSINNKLSKWEFVFILHNLEGIEAVEDDFIAIVPSEDQRMLEIYQKNECLHHIAESFVDEFGRKRKPSFLIARKGSALDIDAIVSFRNVFAISCMLSSWKASIGKPNVVGSAYSDYFDFYPITGIDKNGRILYQSPALWGMETEHKSFKGHTSASLPSSKGLLIEPEEEYYESLNKYWDRFYIKKRGQRWHGTVLFRSLETAYNAASVFDGNKSSIYDFGASISLWISAIEILFHPWRGSVGLKTVLKRMRSAKWRNWRIRNSLYRIVYEGKSYRVNLVEKLYFNLHIARNKFLHGNKVTFNDMHALRNRKKMPLTHVAPLLYNVALKCFLGIKTPHVEKEYDYNEVFLRSIRHDMLESALLETIKDRNTEAIKSGS